MIAAWSLPVASGFTSSDTLALSAGVGIALAVTAVLFGLLVAFLFLRRILGVASA